MMQDILALMIVLACALYLLRSFYQSFTHKKSCASGCGSCAQSQKPIPIRIGPLKKD